MYRVPDSLCVSYVLVGVRARESRASTRSERNRNSPAALDVNTNKLLPATAEGTSPDAAVYVAAAAAGGHVSSVRRLKSVNHAFHPPPPLLTLLVGRRQTGQWRRPHGPQIDTPWTGRLTECEETEGKNGGNRTHVHIPTVFSCWSPQSSTHEVNSF